VADIRLASGSLQNFLNYTSDCPNIVPMRGASPGDFADWPQESLDLIFLDGVHHNPGFREDLNFWYWRLKPGGTLCGHDCARTHPDVLWTVHDFCKDLQLRFLVQERIWILQRPPVRPLSSLL
jgi:SAM-dependent methyltransferase